MLPLTLFFVVPALVAATGSEACPTVKQLGDAWRSLPSSAGAPLPGFVARANVVREAKSARLELLDAEGLAVAVLLLPAEASCADLAFAAALAIEARRGEVVIDRPQPTLAPRVQAAALVEAPALSVDVDAAVAGSWASGLAPGGQLGVSFGRARSGLRGSVSVYGASPRELTVGAGRARWYAFAIDLSLAYRLTAAWLGLEAHAGPALSFLRVEGEGFTANFARGGTTAALAAGVRARFSDSRLLPTLGVSVRWWPGAQRVTVTGVETSAVLPRLEVVLTAGGSFRAL